MANYQTINYIRNRFSNVESSSKYFWLAFFFLASFATSASAQQCLPISTINCPDIVVGNSFSLNFSGSEGGLLDKNGLGTGFKMVDNPSSPLVPPSNPSFPGYEPSKLEVVNGRLQITSTSGISAKSPATSANTNSQVNALGVGVVVGESFIVQTRLIQPSAGTGKFEQAGLWFGLDEDNYIKLDVVSAGSGRNQIEMVREVNAIADNSDAIKSSNMVLSSSEVLLKLVVDTESNKLIGYYSINAGAEVKLGELSLPSSYKAGRVIGQTTTSSFAGIYTTNRNSNTPIVFTFDEFNIQPLIPAVTNTLSISPVSLNFSVEQNGTTSNQNVSLSASQGAPTVNLTKSAGSDWLSLPASAPLGNLVVGINATSLAPGTYQSTVTATAAGYAPSVLNVSLVVNQAKSLAFGQATRNVFLTQGNSQNIQEVVTSSDNSGVSVSLNALTPQNQVPSWVGLNGNPISNINSNSGSAILLEYNTVGLAAGTYHATVTASAPGYIPASLQLTLTVSDGNVVIPSIVSLLPSDDAFVRNGKYSTINYGAADVLETKTVAVNGFTRHTYLKFSLENINSITSAKLRIYGKNADNDAAILMSVYGIDNDLWSEGSINWNTAPAISTGALSSVGVSNIEKYYEFDVSEFVKSQLTGNKIVSLMVKDPVNSDKFLAFNSKENTLNKPELLIETTSGGNEDEDEIPPFVTIQLTGQTLSQNLFIGQVAVEITATDEGGSDVQSVHYSVNGAAEILYSSSFSLTAPGDYTLVAKATDGQGNVGTSETLSFSIVQENTEVPTVVSLSPIADSYTRHGTFENTNYGGENNLLTKSVNVNNFSREGYIKFSLQGLHYITGAKLRFYGKNVDNQLLIPISVQGIEDDSWEEMQITWKNAPNSTTPVLSTVEVSGEEKYYELDVTNFVLEQFGKDQLASFKFYDATNKNTSVSFNSKESGINIPQLIITSGVGGEDTTPPVVSIQLNGVFQSANTYKNEVELVINASDAGGSGLASRQYSVNNGPYIEYSAPVILSTPGAYSLRAKAIDGEGNTTTTNAVSFSIISVASSNNLLFVENLDKFPANDHLVFARIQTPWSRDGVVYNSNHDEVTLRIHNKGTNPLVISDLIMSNTNTFKIEKLKGATYTPGSGLPFNINSGTYADILVKFIAQNQASRVKVLHETLTILSNDDAAPSKLVHLHGLWQKQGEGSFEPYAQEMIDAFGFKTIVGFGKNDPDKGNLSKPKGDEILSSYFVRADASKPVSIRQMGAYHGCCNSTERIMWNPKGTSTLNTVFTHIALDGQTLLPRRTTGGLPAEGTFNPTGAFGFKIGGVDWTDPTKNPGGVIGIRVWIAKDANGNIIPNSYIIANDYLGSDFTNYDYNDNMYFISNMKPEVGTAYYSTLSPSLSSLNFEEQLISSTTTLQLTLSSLGQLYPNGSKDPNLLITSVELTGPNKSEFLVGSPVKTTLVPQESTTMAVTFKPVSQGLKNAAILVHYNNSPVPLRVPLYGISKGQDVNVTAHFRINSGANSAVTIGGKTWLADDQYAYDNLEPYKNAALTQVLATDEDEIYLIEQSSNGDKRPFRYEIPVANGNYVVRLHFAEIYWGTPGSGLTGGAGSRVFSVSLENTLRIANLDVAGEVGPATALVKDLPVTVTDGKLNINFTATVNRPMVCAVEVYSFDASNAVKRTAAPVATLQPLSDFEDTQFSKLKVYPNPSQGRFTIDIPADYKGSATIALVDPYGKLVHLSSSAIQEGGASKEMDLSNLFLKSGVYFLKVQSENGKNEVIKLIIN